MALLTLENVTFSYRENLRVIKGISLSVEKGEYLSIIGRNGSGKSTLSKLFNALLLPDTGKVIVDGLDSTDKSALFEIRKRVGVVFQNPDNGIIASIVEDDVAFGPENLGYPREDIKNRIDYALKAVGMEKYRNSSPMHLSGGQKQRVAIAGVLALKPKILVLDESTAMLDPQGRKEVLKVVEDLNKNHGVTVISITHYMDEVLSSDKVIVLDDGRIALSGTPQEIFEKENEIKELGIELPLSSYIAKKLRENKVDISKGITDENSLLSALWKL